MKGSKPVLSYQSLLETLSSCSSWVNTMLLTALNCNHDVFKKAGVNLANANVIYFQKIIT